MSSTVRCRRACRPRPVRAPVRPWRYQEREEAMAVPQPRSPAARLTALDPAGPGSRAAWFRLRAGAWERGYVRRARMPWPFLP